MENKITNNCITCNCEISKEVDYCQSCEQKELTGIRGWLILPAAGLVISTVLIILSLVSSIRFLVDFFFIDNNKLIDIFIFDVICAFFLLLLSIYTCYLFFLKKRKLPAIFIFLVIISVVIRIVGLFFTSYLIDIKISFDHAVIIIRHIIYACIWVPYFLYSRRVKLTFVR